MATKAGVFEYIIDGTSGVSPRGTIDAMIVGICSKGVAGTAYHLGSDSKVEDILGAGPLTNTVNDVFAGAKHRGSNQEISLVAVPVPMGPENVVDGAIKGLNADKSGLKVDAMPDGKTESDIPKITLTGTPKAATQIKVKITTTGKADKDGEENIGAFQYSIDGGDLWNYEQVIPAADSKSKNKFFIEEFNITINFLADTTYYKDTVYSCYTTDPVPTRNTPFTAIEEALKLNDVRVIYIAGATDGIDWAMMGKQADILFNQHRPTLFMGETSIPASDDINTVTTWANELIKNQKSKATHRFVSICAQYGELIDNKGRSFRKNWGGLLLGRILSQKTNRHIGRVKSGPIPSATLPASSVNIQGLLQNAGFVTAEKFVGLDGCYWAEDKTLADQASDYQNIRAVLTVFKAIRLARAAALPFLRDEAGDVTLSGGSGINALKAQIDSTIRSRMVGEYSLTNELAELIVTIPTGQSPVDGVNVILDFIGIPVIGAIKLFARYTIAGTTSDPRMGLKA